MPLAQAGRKLISKSVEVYNGDFRGKFVHGDEISG